jgi:uncharacterized Tic20 family protein
MTRQKKGQFPQSLELTFFYNFAGKDYNATEFSNLHRLPETNLLTRITKMPRQDDDEDRNDDDREPTKKRRSDDPTNEDRQMAMFCHLGNLLGMIVLPLVIWLTQKDKSSFIDAHGKEAVNFGITMMIGHFLGVFTCGILNMILIPVGITFGIMAGLAANRGEDYKYPICIRFIT